jgi:hypothetical protein
MKLINKKQTAKEIIGEYMDTILEMSITEEPEQITALELKRDGLQLKMKEKVKSIDYFSQNLKERDYLLSAEIEANLVMKMVFWKQILLGINYTKPLVVL